MKPAHPEHPEHPVHSAKTTDDWPGAAERLHARREKHRQEQRSMMAMAARVAGLGWMVVIPGVLGLYLGRWLDGRIGEGGGAFAAGLLVLGLGVGSLLAFRSLPK